MSNLGCYLLKRDVRLYRFSPSKIATKEAEKSGVLLQKRGGTNSLDLPGTLIRLNFHFSLPPQLINGRESFRDEDDVQP